MIDIRMMMKMVVVIAMWAGLVALGILSWIVL